MSTAAKRAANPNPLPTYFFSHGAPSFIYEDAFLTDRGAWKTVKKLGSHIKNDLKPDYIIVVSAHWQSSRSNLVEIGAPKTGYLGENDLIYDFGGFQPSLYREEFHTKNSELISRELQAAFEKDNFDSKISKRGLDHGVWVPLKVAFSEYTQLSGQRSEGLDLPETALIQVSLTADEDDIGTHYRMGQVLRQFKENLIWDEANGKYLKGMIVCSGMSVHNLRDIGRASVQSEPMSYVRPFQEILRKTLVNGPDLEAKLKSIQEHHSRLLYQAHPTLEHFVPLVVASGSLASHEKVTELYNKDGGSLGWGIFEFGQGQGRLEV